MLAAAVDVADYNGSTCSKMAPQREFHDPLSAPVASCSSTSLSCHALDEKEMIMEMMIIHPHRPHQHLMFVSERVQSHATVQQQKIESMKTNRTTRR